MHICLINPPALDTIQAEVPSFIKEERGINPPLGLLYLASRLQKEEGITVSVIDAQERGFSYKDTALAAAAQKPDLVGITAMTMTMRDVLYTCRELKLLLPHTLICLGGPHATIYPEETLRLEHIDYAVTGEGEEPFTRLVKELQRGNTVPREKNIACLDGQKHLVYPGMGEYLRNLDDLPFPARTLIRYRNYGSVLSRHRIVTTMFTSRGCPFRCAFCNRPHMGTNFRPRSAENVFREFQECAALGIGEILVYDDTFTVDKARVHQLCERILQSGLRIDWDIRSRVDTVDAPMLRALKKAGCTRIHYGVESGSDAVLKELKKGITVSQAEGVLRMTKEAGISTLAYFMIGSPHETEKEVGETISLLRRIRADYAHITIFTPFPATELYLRALKEGVIPHDYWREFAQDPLAPLTVRYWEKDIPRERMFELLKKAYQAFYSRPLYLAKRLFAIRSLSELKTKCRAGLKILRH